MTVEYNRKAVTIHATSPSGFHVAFELDIEGSLIAAAEELTAELARRGYTATSAAPSAPASTARPAARTPQPEAVYKPDGTPCCPHHLKELRQGQHGLFCPAKAEGEIANAKGYCTFSLKS